MGDSRWRARARRAIGGADLRQPSAVRADGSIRNASTRLPPGLLQVCRASARASRSEHGASSGQDGRVSEALGHRPEDPPPGLAAQLDDRLRRLPVARVRSFADYYALRSVEIDHIKRFARRFDLSEEQRASVEDEWLRRVADALTDRKQSILDQHRQAFLRWMTKHHRRRLSPAHSSRLSRFALTVLHQARFNTVGPGGRTWFGNRYVSIRRYTFRLHWRP